MSTFILAHKDEHLFQERALKALARVAGTRPVAWELGNWRLWIAPRRLGPSDEVERLDGHRLWTAGCCVVHGLPRDEGRQWILETLASGGDPTAELQGAWLLLHWDCRSPRIWHDPAGVAPLYHDPRGRVLSNSLLTLAAARLEAPTLDPDALLQQVCMGFPLTPRTLVSGIHRISSAGPDGTEAGLVRKGSVQGSDESPKGPGFSAHVDHQLGMLRRWFLGLAPHAASLPPDVGVSGGYDSRLLLLLLAEAAVDPSLHTLVKNRENVDHRSACGLADLLGRPLKEHAPPAWGSLDPTDLWSEAERTLWLYDGRPALLMSVFKPEYSPAYRTGLLEARRLSISGVGGEIYRNYCHHRVLGAGDAAAWIGFHLVEPHVVSCLDDARGTLGRLAGQLAERLGFPSTVRAGLDYARRFYGEVWLPDWHGNRNSAENRLAEYLSPFADARLVQAAWASRHCLGVDGAFEAAMLRRLDPRVARLPSSYGHSLDHIPSSVTIRSALRSLAPNRWKLAMGGHRTVPPSRRPDEVERRALQPLRELGLPLDLDRYIEKSDRRDLALSTGMALDLMGRLGALLDADRPVDPQTGSLVTLRRK